jgi:hypothetical protein
LTIQHHTQVAVVTPDPLHLARAGRATHRDRV